MNFIDFETLEQKYTPAESSVTVRLVGNGPENLNFNNPDLDPCTLIMRAAGTDTGQVYLIVDSAKEEGDGYTVFELAIYSDVFESMGIVDPFINGFPAVLLGLESDNAGNYFAGMYLNKDVQIEDS